MPVIRPGGPQDLAEVAAIQAASPEAAQWNVGEYLERGFLVAVGGSRIAGFVIYSTVAEGECEVLNLAVAVEFRRQGVARELIASLVGGFRGVLYLEVRESNQAARNFYESVGFQEVGVRPGYYQSPPEAAIVMKFHSC
jgi:ribosomal-protein-alanine acetyltransferase